MKHEENTIEATLKDSVDSFMNEVASMQYGAQIKRTVLQLRAQCASMRNEGEAK